MEYTSKNLKAGLLCYLNFQRQFIAGTEVPIGDCCISDVVAYDHKKEKSYDIEVKISKSDLKAELKKYKHRMKGKVNIANYYYFCIPAELYSKCLSFIEENFSNAGIMTFTKLEKADYFHEKCGKIYIMKRAKLINVGVNNKYILKNITKRMGNEITGMYLDKYNLY